MRAIVLGCGPAGLMATHALTSQGHDVLVYSKKRKSELHGAQYLHMPIPGMTDVPSRAVEYRLDGTVEQYRVKVYGRQSTVKVSPESLGVNHEAWDIRRTYDNLWDTYGNFVQDHELSSDVVPALLRYGADVVFNTAPASVLCADFEAHSFISESVWAVGDAPERGIFCPVAVPAETIVCNGLAVPAWYRASNVFGRRTAEWPGRNRPPIDNVALVHKPLKTNCNCWPDVIRLGRYGKWNKGILSHTAYVEARDFAMSHGTQGVLFR